MRRVIALSIVVMLLAAVLPLLAQNGESAKSSSSSSSRSSAAKKNASRTKAALKITPGREALALTFAKKYHPELNELLIYLKENSQPAYRRAVFSLYRTSERLAQYQDRGDTARYDLELKLWQARSRSQLIVAKLKMGESEQLRKSLRETVNEQLELQALIFKHNREKMSVRLEKLDEQIRRLTDDRENQVDRQIRLLTKSPKTKTVNSSSRSNKQAASDQPRKKTQPKK